MTRLSRAVVRSLFAVLLCALLVFVWLALRVRAHETDGFDGALRATLHAHASPSLTQLAIVASDTLAPGRLAALGLVVSALLAWQRRVRLAALLFSVMAGVLVLDQAVKPLFHRARPLAYFGYKQPHSFSFPSGHSLFACCFFASMAFLLTTVLPSRWARVAVWLGAIAMIVSVGASRVYLGVHHPSDVLAGYSLGLGWLAAVGLAHHATASPTETLQPTNAPKDT